MSKKASNRPVTLNDNTFFYRKNTRDTVLNFGAFEEKCAAKMKAAYDDTSTYIETDYGPRPAYDRYDYYVDILGFILCGDTNTIKAEELDAAEVEEVILGFLPESMRFLSMLMGFSNRS